MNILELDNKLRILHNLVNGAENEFMKFISKKCMFEPSFVKMQNTPNEHAMLTGYTPYYADPDEVLIITSVFWDDYNHTTKFMVRDRNGITVSLDVTQIVLLEK